MATFISVTDTGRHRDTFELNMDLVVQRWSDRDGSTHLVTVDQMNRGVQVRVREPLDELKRLTTAERIRMAQELAMPQVTTGSRRIWPDPPTVGRELG